MRGRWPTGASRVANPRPHAPLPVRHLDLDRREEPAKQHFPRLLTQRIAADETATCVPVALEVLTGPPTGEALDRDWDKVWQHLRWLPVDEAMIGRALEVLRELAYTTAGLTGAARSTTSSPPAQKPQVTSSSGTGTPTSP